MKRRIACAFAFLIAAASIQAATTSYSFDKSSYTFHEGDGSAIITAIRSGDTSASTTIHYGWSIEVLPGVAPNGGNGTLTFAPGETSKPIVFPIPNDGYYTGGMPAFISLTPVGVSEEYARAKIDVLDDEPIPTLTGSVASVAEGNYATTAVTLHYHLSAPLGWREDMYPYPIGGTATRDTDYIAPTYMGAMDLHQTDFDFVVQVRGDIIPEPDETVIPTMTISVRNGGPPIQGTATLTILNDEYILTPATQKIDRGKSGELQLSTSVPASTTERIQLATDSATIAAVPPFVDVPAGATSASIPVTGVGAGTVNITASLPASRGGFTVSSVVTVIEFSGLAFEPQTMDLTVGATQNAVVHLSPRPESPVTLTLNNNSPATFETPGSFEIDANGNGSFPVRGRAPGRGLVVVTLPAYLGAGTYVLQVNVTVPVGLAITSLSSISGPASGNQPVTLFGTNISGRCTVTFGGLAALNTAVATNGSISTYTPPHAPGGVDVAIRCGTDQFTFPSGYTYTLATPRLTRVTPASGSIRGGTVVTATGENLPRGRCALFIGGNAATTITNLQPAEMVAVAPPHADGLATVTLRCGTDFSSLADAFLYTADEPLANIAVANPREAAPGERVMIGGSRFRASDNIFFGGAAALDMSTGPTEHFVTVPEMPSGPVTVTLRDADGRTVTGPSFTVKPPAGVVLTSAPPKATAGAEIVVNGSGFRPALSFVLGGVTLRSVVVASTYAVLRVPKTMAPQATTFSVNDAAGTALASRAMEVVANGVAVESATPQCVSTEGGVLVTISGSGFAPGAVVTFGIADGTNVEVRDAHTIVARAPASSGVSDATITVTNPSLESGQLTNGFVYRWPESACGGSKRRATRH